MPITITPVGSTLNATIVDGNFAQLETMLREQVIAGDIKNGQFTRLYVKQYEQGRLMSAGSMALPVIDDHAGDSQNTQAVYDLNYRHVKSSQDPLVQMSQTMELLGRPGPSMYWQFQEDGLAAVGTTPDPNRYPDDLCYSAWKTVPGASLRVYVPHPCAADIEASAYFLGCTAATGKYDNDGPGGKSEWDNNFSIHGDQIAARWAIVVDTNPELHNDEWANTNPNIKNPLTGAQATHRSWNFVSEKKIATPLWQKESIDGRVILKGGRWYNFSLKYKGAGTMGYVTGGNTKDAIYEIDAGALPNWAGGNYQTLAHIPPFENLWISTGLHIDFIYGYGSIVDDTANITTAP